MTNNVTSGDMMDIDLNEIKEESERFGRPLLRAFPELIEMPQPEVAVRSKKVFEEIIESVARQQGSSNAAIKEALKQSDNAKLPSNPLIAKLSLAGIQHFVMDHLPVSPKEANHLAEVIRASINPETANAGDVLVGATFFLARFLWSVPPSERDRALIDYMGDFKGYIGFALPPHSAPSRHR